MSAPTLEDVAKMAGVSTASISRALNTPGKVAPETRDRIEKAIEALGYTPNFGGRALASGRANTVGAVIPSMANAMFANALQSFQEALTGAGVNLLVATTGFDPSQELSAIKSLVAHGADGLMLIGNERPDETWSFLEKRRVPYIIAWSNTARRGQRFVGFDNGKAAAGATYHALTLGHRKVAMISGRTQGNDRARARRDGVVAAVEAFGSGARITHIAEADYLLDEGGHAFREIMSAPEAPTVVICGNDALAAGGMVAARELGISLPDQMSFVGFDDIGLARVVTPALTTVRVPQDGIGRETARLLLGCLSGEDAGGSVTLDTTFVRRASLVAPSR